MGLSIFTRVYILEPNLTFHTRNWALDALHVNISTCYRKSVCSWSGEVIGYDHFFDTCPFLFEWIALWNYEDGTELWLTAHFLWLTQHDSSLDSCLTVCSRLIDKNKLNKES